MSNSFSSHATYLTPEDRADILGLRFVDEPGDGGGSGDASPGGKTFSEDYVKTLRAESAGYRTQVRERDSQIASLTAERDEARSALQTAEAKTGEVDGLVAEANARALRFEVALEKNLPPTLAARLVGTTKDELVADADALAALAGDRGTARFDQGNTPLPPSSPDVNGALRALSGRG